MKQGRNKKKINTDPLGRWVGELKEVAVYSETE